MKPLFVLTIALLSLASCVKKSDYDKLKAENDSLANQLTIEHAHVQIKNTVVHEMNSKFTKGAYDIYVSYPDNYKTSGKKYPVLVVLDAEVNFGAVNYLAQRLKKDELAPELLIVGIAYRGETDENTYYTLRSKDFTPTKDKDWKHADTGGADDFVKFLSQELFPYLSKIFQSKKMRRYCMAILSEVCLGSMFCLIIPNFLTITFCSVHRCGGTALIF